jgi:phage I-like protein
MEDLTALGVGVAVGAIDARGRSWVQVMVTTQGEVAQNHGKFVIDEADLAAYAASLADNGDRTPVDYDHSYAEGKGTLAAGWFTGAAKVIAADEPRPDGKTAAEPELWAEVEWTPTAAQEIREGKYRFLSPEFSFKERDKQGVLRKAARLLAAALTNRPFFDRMEPVTAKDNNKGDDAQEENMDAKILKALGLAEDADTDAAVAKIAELATAGQHDDGNKLLRALGVDPTAERDQRIATALRAKDDKIISLETDLSEMRAELAKNGKLNDRIEELEKRDRERDIEVILTKAVTDGKVLPAEKETLADLFVENVAGLKTLIAKRTAGMFVHKATGVGGKERAADLGDPDMAKLSSEFKSDDPIGEDGARAHVAALAILKERGKASGYTGDEYLDALSEAEQLVG